MLAPFGSEEFLTINYGLKGVDYNIDDQGNPVQTAKGKVDAPASTVWGYVVAPSQVYYNTQNPKNFATMMQAGDKAMVAVGVDDPVTDQREKAQDEQRDDEVAQPARLRGFPLVTERQEDGDHDEHADDVRDQHRRQQIVADRRRHCSLVRLEPTTGMAAARPQRDEREQADDGETSEARRQRPRQPLLALSVHARAETTSILRR